MKQQPTESQARGRHEARPIPATIATVLSLALVAVAVGGPQLPSARSGTSKTTRTTRKAPAAKKPTPPPKAPARTPYVVLGFNELGMHCMNSEFSEMCILPPYNTLHAQVIDRSGEEPRIVTSGIQVKYSIPGNSKSSTKTNFWIHAQALFGLAKPLPNDIGLTGNGMSGFMKPNPDGDFSVTGIPITPITDAGVLDPFQLSLIQVIRNGKTQAETRAVVPVSWEISCNICHSGGPGVSVATDILSKHDAKHKTMLVAQKNNGKPVLCAGCHADPALGTAGAPGVKSMSHAMHGSHADRMGPAASYVTNSCYACHPGKKTECLRDIHFMKGMSCTDCHGGMTAVANPNRRPWVDEPKCGDCHKRAGFAFEEPGKNYKESRGHNGVKCASCHGSPHAVTPTAVAADNVQAIAVQGHAGTINDCKVCHTKVPRERFNHTLDD